MKLVTAEQMRAIDRRTIEQLGIPGEKLMENAGRGIAQRILDEIIQFPDARVVVFCGKGNNGGDGFVIARHLHKSEVGVQVYHLGPVSAFSEEARVNYDRARECGIECTLLESAAQFPEHLNADFIVDALFGTGFTGAPHGVAEDLIAFMNDQPQPIIAVDLPSGLNADTGDFEGEVVMADYTCSLALPKYGLYVSPGRELAGAVSVVPIGIPDEAVKEFSLSTELITASYVALHLPERPPAGHKGTFGKLLLVAGSVGLTGAAALAATAALRSGCGLAKIACPESIWPVIAAQTLEATLHPVPDVARRGALALRALGEIRKLAAEHDAVVVGPGLGRHHETAELVRRLVPSLTGSVLVDADGINAFEGHCELFKGAAGEIILTPHPGEFQRLSGEAVPNDIHERLALVRSCAAEWGVHLVLKGSPTVYAAPDGQVALNPTGNDGMATGGSGDVLSGLIGSLLVQGMDLSRAVRCGLYLHGLAGDLGVEELGRRSLIAGDIIAFLPEAFQLLDELSEEE